MSGWKMYRWAALTIVLGLAILLWITGPMRTNQRDWADRKSVVVRFIEAVKKEDFVEAAEYWRTGDTANIEANWQIPFSQFCIQRFKCEHYSLERPRRDKQIYVINFVCRDGESTKKFDLFLREIDGQWRLIEDKWLE